MDRPASPEKPASADRRRIVALLSALVALTGALLVALAAGGVVLWREYARVRGAVAAAAGEGGGSARDLAVEVSRRQQVMSAELAAMSRDASRQIGEFERRAAELRTHRGGPITNTATALEMTQLMSDEMLLQLKLMTTLNSVLEKTARPLPAQHELLRDAARGGGAGEGGRRQARGGRRE